MIKQYIVRLSDEERKVCQDIVNKLKGSGQKFKRAQFLLKADVNGPVWTDAKIADAFNCRVSTMENLRKRLVLGGFEQALIGKKRAEPPKVALRGATPRKLDGKMEAQLKVALRGAIAMRLGKPPAGYGRWTLRLLADEMVTLEVVDHMAPRRATFSHETVRKVLKKTE